MLLEGCKNTAAAKAFHRERRAEWSPRVFLALFTMANATLSARDLSVYFPINVSPGKDSGFGRNKECVGNSG